MLGNWLPSGRNDLHGSRSLRTNDAEMLKAMYVSAKRLTPPGEGSEPAMTVPGNNVVAFPQRTPGRAERPDESDASLVTSLAAGDTAAFQALMQRHLSAVVATARRIVREEAEAEDIAQDTFLRLWDKAAELEISDHGVRPWLRRVASNRAIDGLRKAQRYDVTDEVPEQPDAPQQLAGLEAADASVRVHEALESLPQRQRIAISLFHFDELSQREVADAMEISEDALESLLARGRRRLREHLKDDWRELLSNDDL